MSKYLSNNKGLGFTELIIAALLMSIVFAGISVLFINAVRELTKSSQQLQALHYAREGIEIMRESVRADSTVTDGWQPQPTSSLDDNWVPLNYWVPDSSVGLPSIKQNSSRKMKIENVSTSGAEAYLRRIDVKVNY